MMVISLILWILAILAAFVLLIFIPEKYTKPTIMVSGLFSILCGTVLYGLGYLYVTNSGALAAVRTVFSVTIIFIGENCFEDIAAAPFFSCTWVQFLFWAVHLTAIFSTAVAAISAFGKKILRRLRLKLLWSRELSVIYGCTDEIADFADKLARHTGGNVLIISRDTGTMTEDRFQEAGCHIRSDAAALEGSISFLRSIGLRRGKRSFHLYCLDADLFDCRNYASKLLTSLKTLQISPQHTSLTLRTSEQLTVTTLQAAQAHYGYGSVELLDLPELAARMLMLRFPPYLQIPFERKGKAEENLHGVIVGFGEIGQAVFRHLVMNGQFEGSVFCCDIFDPDYSQRYGKLKSLSPGLFTQYETRFHEVDACSDHFYNFLIEKGSALKYIVLCTGSESNNLRIARELSDFLIRFNIPTKLFLCDTKSVRAILPDGSAKQFELFEPSLLATDSLDRRAMALNYSYCNDPSLTAREAWLRCDYFSRLSSRASADFAEAMAYAAGIDTQIPPENWTPDEELLENLAKTEHLRWCAFHYAMGFTAMSNEEFADRCKQFAAEKQACGQGKIRVGKDLQARRHACLIPWDDLDELSQKENAATGRDVDYKQLDRNNVLALPTLLKTKKG